MGPQFNLNLESLQIKPTHYNYNNATCDESCLWLCFVSFLCNREQDSWRGAQFTNISEKDRMKNVPKLKSSKKEGIKETKKNLYEIIRYFLSFSFAVMQGLRPRKQSWKALYSSFIRLYSSNKIKQIKVNLLCS